MGFLFGSSKNVPKEQPRLFGAQKERVSTNESARVLPWFAGTRWLGVTWLGDVFDVHTSPIRQKIGKKKQTTGYKYFSSFTGLISNGIVDRITKIKFNDELVWTGNVERGSADFTSITLESRGTIHFHFGTDTQNLHPLLAASGQNHSAYRGQCYIIGEDIFLGPDTTTVPNVQVEVERVGKPSWWTGDYLIGHDANPMSVLWEWWADKRFGAGRSDDDLDTTRLLAAAATLRSEGLGVSPLITTETTFKELALRLFEHIDAFPTSYNGKFGCELARAATGTISTLTETSLMSDPEIASQQWPDTSNETRVKFTNFDKDGDDDIAIHHDRANFVITGRNKAQNVDRPWVTTYATAAKIASAMGRVAGLPQSKGSLTLRESQAASILVGTVFNLQTRDGETLQMRCTGRTEAGPDRRHVEIEFETDHSWANSEYSIPTQAATPETPVFAPELPNAVQIQDAPYAFADPELSTLMWLVARGDDHSTGYDVWKSIAAGGPFSAASDLRKAELFANFCVRAKLSIAYASTTAKIDDSIGIIFEVLSPDQELLEDEWDQADALDHKLLAIFGATGNEIMSLYNVSRQSATTFTAKTVRGLYDTRRRTHAVNTPIWLQLRSKIDSFAWPPFSESARYYKFQSHFGNAETDLAETGAISHTENARSLLPLAPKNLRANGDGNHATWATTDDLTVTWSNTSRKRSTFGLPFGEKPATDLESIALEFRSYDGSTLIKTRDESPTGETVTFTSGQLAEWGVNSDFSLRCYGVRSGRRSLDYDEVFVRKV